MFSSSKLMLTNKKLAPVISGWSQMGSDIVGGEMWDSGESVSLSSNGYFVAISGYRVRAYSWNGSSWLKRGSDITGPGGFGGGRVSLSSDGLSLAVGLSDLNDAGNAGQVNFYDWSTGASDWIFGKPSIVGEAQGDESAYGLDLSGDGSSVVIGARYNQDGGFGAGHVRTYVYSGSWTKRGSDIDGVGPTEIGSSISADMEGWSVSFNENGTVMATGAPGNRQYKGRVQIYAWSGSSWSKRGSEILGDNAGDWSGSSVSLNGDGSVVAIGSPENNSASGNVRVYTWNGSSWAKRGATISGKGPSDFFGSSVSLSNDGSAISIGAPETGSGSGYVQVYNWNGSSWIQRGSDIYAGEGDRVGWSTSLSGDGSIVAVGMPGVGPREGRVRVYTAI
jgi:hypothetical protein